MKGVGSYLLKGELQDWSGVKMKILSENMRTNQPPNGESCTKFHPWEAQGRADRFRWPLTSACRVSVDAGLGLKIG